MISSVDSIFYFNPNDIKIEYDSDIIIQGQGKNQLANLQASGLQDNIDQYNLTGTGINVGIIDTGFTYNNLNDYFSRVNISTNVQYTPMTEEECKNSPEENGNLRTHGDYVSAIIGANGNNFKGPVKDCNMFFTNPKNIPTGIDWLIDKGCNVINFSGGYSEDKNSYNQYAKWLDTIAIRANVTFVKSAGNKGRNKLPGMSMCYNPIVVGSCDNNNIIWEYSSYVDIEGKQYKPDIVVQGEDAVSPYGSAVGTSSAAPLVTAAAAQLCQYSLLLMNDPIALKSVLLNGATYLGQENINNSDIDFNALSRKSGAGVLNANKAILAYNTQNIIGKTINSSNKKINGTLYVSSAKKQVHITLCSQKKNVIFGTDVNVWNNVNVGPTVGFKLKVTCASDNSYTYYSRSTTDNKVSVIFTPPKKGYYNIEGTAIIDFGNNSTYAVMTYTSV